MRPRIVELVNNYFHANIGQYIVPAPAVMYVLAIFAVTLLFVRRSPGDKNTRYHALGLSLWAIIGGLVGARALFL